jgi:hypothetical protein
LSRNVLERIQELVRRGAWQASVHVLDYLADGEFEVEDIECCIANGRVRKIDTDEVGAAVDGNKYVICGTDQSGLAFETVGKIIEGGDGKLYFVITAYARTS